MNQFDSYLLDRRLVKRAFEAAVATYDATAKLQQEVCDRLLHRLDYVKLRPQRVLDLGCGTGQAAAALRRGSAGATPRRGTPRRGSG